MFLQIGLRTSWCGLTTYQPIDTSLAFSYIERILRSPDPNLAVASALTAIDATLNTLQAAGFDPMVVSGDSHVEATLCAYMKDSTKTFQIFSNLLSNKLSSLIQGARS